METALATPRYLNTQVATQQSSMTNPFGSPDSFKNALEMASFLSKSSMVPDVFRAEKVGEDVAKSNCIIAMEMAYRLGIGMLECYQNIAVIHGKPTFSAAFMIGRLNNSGLIKGQVRWEIAKGKEGGIQGARAGALDAATNEMVWGSWITMAMAKQAGWIDRSGSQWLKMPEQMLKYRSAAFMIRTCYPEILLGLHTTDEIVDRGAPTAVVIDSINDALTGKSSTATEDNVDYIDVTPVGSSHDAVVSPTDAGIVDEPSSPKYPMGVDAETVARIQAEADAEAEIKAKEKAEKAAERAIAKAEKDREREKKKAAEEAASARKQRALRTFEMFKIDLGWAADKVLGEIARFGVPADVNAWTDKNIDDLNARLVHLRREARKAEQQSGEPEGMDPCDMGEPNLSHEELTEIESQPDDNQGQPSAEDLAAFADADDDGSQPAFF